MMMRLPTGGLVPLIGNLLMILLVRIARVLDQVLVDKKVFVTAIRHPYKVILQFTVILPLSLVRSRVYRRRLRMIDIK